MVRGHLARDFHDFSPTFRVRCHGLTKRSQLINRVFGFLGADWESAEQPCGEDGQQDVHVAIEQFCSIRIFLPADAGTPL